MNRTSFAVVCACCGMALAAGCGKRDPRIAEWNAANDKVVGLYAQGRTQEAVPHATNALRMATEWFGSNSLACATSCENLGEIYRCEGKFVEAVALFERAVAIRDHAARDPRRDGRRARRDMLAAMNSLACMYGDTGQFDKAAALLDRVVPLAETVYGRNSRDFGVVLNNAGSLYNRVLGRQADARACAERAEAILGPRY